MTRINVVVGVIGALVLILAASGVMEIRSRAGPFEEPLTPTEFVATTSGHYVASGPSGTIGPGNVCVPAAGETQCRDARLEIDLTVAGLPIVTKPAQYHVFLVHGEAEHLGAMLRSGDRYTFHLEDQRDARGSQALLITLERDAPTRPGPLSFARIDVSELGEESPATIAHTARAVIPGGQGAVRAAEIGAFAKSTTAIGQLDAMTVFPGWHYHAWFVSFDKTSFLDLGPWEMSDDSTEAQLDGRVENVRLEDQSGFLTTLEPLDDTRAAPSGPPVFMVEFLVADATMD